MGSLNFVLRGAAPASLLASYEIERGQAADDNIRHSTRSTDFIAPHSKQERRLRDAVLANGIMVHGLDFDDTHLRGVVHATASVFPTALALSWARQVPGRDLLTAYVAGMEVATRLGCVARGELIGEPGVDRVGVGPS